MKLIVTICLTILFFACGNKENEVPEGILPPRKMQAVLWDIIRADELINYEASLNPGINRQQKNINLYTKVFSLHAVSEPDFKRSYAYYIKAPGKLKVILDSLQHRKAPVQKQAVKPI